MTDLTDLGLVEAAGLVRWRRVSPVELLEASLARIEAVEPRVGAFVELTADRAMASAREAEQEVAGGRYRSLLHGIPVAVKDVIAVAGVPLTAGSAVLDDFVPEADAHVVASLREAGAVIVGTTKPDEFAFGTVGAGILNPAAEDRSTGGSSSGSAAAVTARMVFGALGTDTGGSVRIPASCCGIVGVKPTGGTVSLEGVIPLAWSNDHVGPLARSVADAAAILGVLQGAPLEVEPPASLAGLRVGLVGDHYLRVAEPGVREAFSVAVERLSSLGASTEEIDLPDSDLALGIQYLTVLPEAAAYHLSRHADRLDRYDPGIRAALDWGARVPARDYLDAQRVRTTLSGRIDRLLEVVDLIALPTMPIEPPMVGQDEVVLGDGRREDVVSAMLRYTCLFDATAHPAVSVPDPDAPPPRGLQLVARRHGEAGLFRAAAAYEGMQR